MAVKRKLAEDALSPVGRKEGAQRRGPGPLFLCRGQFHLLRREAADDRKPGGGGGPDASRQTRPARGAVQTLLTPPQRRAGTGPQGTPAVRPNVIRRTHGRPQRQAGLAPGSNECGAEFWTAVYHDQFSPRLTDLECKERKPEQLPVPTLPRRVLFSPLSSQVRQKSWKYVEIQL